jgi:hypothetical protein
MTDEARCKLNTFRNMHMHSDQNGEFLLLIDIWHLDDLVLTPLVVY